VSEPSAVADKQAIYDVLCTYCRALDRMDKTLAYSVWTETSTAHYHDIFEGSGQGFIDWVWEAHSGMERHSHQIGNHLIRLDGDRASSETYVTVTLWTNVDEAGQQQEIIGKGRYLDTWLKREGSWRIASREHVLDIQTVQKLQRGYVNAVSSRDSSDPSYQLNPSI